jgi:hypothetical protein
MNTYYIIIPSTYVQNINFEQVLETSVDTLRFNNDQTKTFVKYQGENPPDIASEALVVDGRTIHSHSQILEILNSPEWISPIEGEE